MLSASVLDVGHGNSTVLHCANEVVVVDAARTAVLLDYLSVAGITEIDALIVSHADADHVGGLVGVFSADAVSIKHLYVNPDAAKLSATWEDFRYAARDYSLRREHSLHTSIHSGDPGTLDFPGITLHILSPDAAVALSGVGHSERGHTVTANDHTVVVQVVAFGRNVMLLLGDVTPWAWNMIEARGWDLRADVAVLPHHGGSFGEADEVDALLATIAPQYAVASNGRGRHDNPRESVVRRVRSRGAQMICTQLSARCGDQGGEDDTAGAACAGTITFEFEESRTVFQGETRHREFVDLIRGGPLCRRT